MPKKILIVANSSWNILNFRTNLILYLSQKGYAVAIAAPEDEFTNVLLSRFHFIEFHPIAHLKASSSNPIAELRLLVELIGLYRKIKPDYALHYTIKPNIWGGIAANILGFPCINTVTGLGFSFINKDIKTLIIKYLYKISFKNNTFSLFHNPDDRAEFISQGIAQTNNSAVVNGSGVDTDFFDYQKQSIKQNFKFLFIGRMLIDKGIQEFVAAASLIKQKYPDTQFIVAGDESPQNPAAISTQALRTWIKQDVIDFRGFRKDVKSLYAEADCFVLPSYREGLSKSIMEAMSMQLPIITTDVPGCNTVVSEPENGFLVPAKDANRLFLAMEKMLHLSETQRSEMGKRNREKIQTAYNYQSINQFYLNIITKND